MLMPSIFGENLFDDFWEFPFFDNSKEQKNIEKKLYGHHSKNMMKTDIKETEKGYTIEMDLPGFKKDEVKVALENGYLTIAAAKGLAGWHTEKYNYKELTAYRKDFPNNDLTDINAGSCS